MTLENVLTEAVNDSYSVNLDGTSTQARLVMGVKIIKDNERDSIKIYNTHKGGDYYREITGSEYSVFEGKGWRHGVYMVAIGNYIDSLDSIQDLVRGEVNKPKLNDKRLSLLKKRRVSVLDKYYKLKLKLNKS